MERAALSTSAHTPLSAKQSRKVAVASFVGTALESYDQYVFAWLAALFAGTLFFEPLGPVGGVLASFATFAVTFVVRPLGAVFFGHLGDRIGRRSTLIITIILMGVATGLIGVLPTYEQMGWFGAIALVILRLAQGLSLGGEWGGAVALTTEHATEKKCSGPVRASVFDIGPCRVQPAQHQQYEGEPNHGGSLREEVADDRILEHDRVGVPPGLALGCRDVRESGVGARQAAQHFDSAVSQVSEEVDEAPATKEEEEGGAK